MIQVTRIEIADHIEAAFHKGPAIRRQLVDEASRTNARAELLHVLSLLERDSYAALGELWMELGHIPVGDVDTVEPGEVAS